MAAPNLDSFAALARASKSRALHSQVISYCTKLAQSSKSQSEEGWAAREMLIKAYLDEGQIEKAVELVKELRNRFGSKSQRVSLLEGITLEAQGKWESAEKLYEDILNTNWNNLSVAKRLVALKRSKGDFAAASKQLNTLLTDNQADVELWLEMCDLQMTLGAFEQALYCAEEILVSNPHSYLSNCLYADLLLTCARSSSAEPLKTKWTADSRSYYSQSLVLRGEQGYSRAAWGLLLCVKAKKASGKEQADELDEKLKVKAAGILRNIYSKSPMRDMVDPVIAQLSQS